MLSPRLIIAAVLVAVLAFTHFFTYRAGRAAVRSEWDKDRAKQLVATEAQRNRNQELQRAAELRYTVRDKIRTEYITTTLKEIQHAASHLASCPVGPDAVRLLNDAAACAIKDTGTACSADKPVHGAP